VNGISVGESLWEEEKEDLEWETDEEWVEGKE
jgi:hypothetical protein